MLKPLRNNCLIKPTPTVKTVGSGLIVRPDNAGEPPAMSGTVVAVADGPASAARVRSSTIAHCLKLVDDVIAHRFARGEDEEVVDGIRKALRGYMSDQGAASDVAVGDVVAFSSHAGYQTTVDGERLLIVAQDELQAVWQP